MREIKFRAWDKKNECYVKNQTVDEDIGPLETYYVRLFLNFDGTIAAFEPDDGGKNGLHEHDAEIDPDRFVVEQSTGLVDKSGREIYEGDIMEYRWVNQKFRGVVRWNERLAHFNVYDISHGEVIGNIYENPDLLK